MYDYQGLVTKWRDESVEEIEPENPPFDMGYNQCLLDCADELAEVIACNAQPSPDAELNRYKRMAGLLREMAEQKPEMKVISAAVVLLGMLEPATEEDIRRGQEIAASLEARPVQQPATEPDERAQYEKWLESLPQCSDGCNGDLIGLDHDENCPLKGIGFATHWDAWQARAALALRDVPQGLDDREIVAEWRSCLCAAWASGHRAVMTMLLESGPSYPARSVPVGPEGKK